MMKQSPGKTRKEAISVSSYAKINLYLEVLFKRVDGFHQLRTLFSEVELHDTISFTLTDDKRIDLLSNISEIINENNTVLKAAKLLKDRFSIDKGLKIDLQKRIPLEAGLGGGSSNAAATLKALNELWELDLTLSELSELGAMIGSDVNFFLVGGTALGEGRGEIITPVDYIPFEHILLVKPDFGISSKEAYEQFKGFGNDPSWQGLLTSKKGEFCFNRLEEGLLTRYAELKEILADMRSEALVKAFVTGSGSTTVGIFSDENGLNERYDYYIDKGYWCCKTKTKRRT